MNILKDIKNINAYILNPKHNIEIHYSTKEKWRILLSCLVYDIVISVLLVMPILLGIDSYIVPLETTDILDKVSLIFILIFTVIIAPIAEELIFRLPLNYEHNYVFNVIQNIINSESNTLEKFWIKYFKPIFYLFSFGFALVHITNYENNQTIFYLLAPLIVLSQGIGGLVLGYVRMHLGLKWAILNHALFNFIIFISMLFSHNSLVLEHKNDTTDLKIQLIEFYDQQEKEIVSFDKNTITSIDWNDESIQKLLDTLYNNNYKTYDNHLAKVKLTTKQPISKEAFLNILKEEYRIVKRDYSKK